jgi:hypothetical protein
MSKKNKKQIKTFDGPLSEEDAEKLVQENQNQ